MNLLRLMLGMMLLAAGPAQAEWLEASTDHFVIYSEQKEPALREYATRLERYDKAMRYNMQIPDQPVGAANRLTIYVVRDLYTVQKLAGRGTSRGGSSIAGFYIPRATGSIAITPRSASAESKFDMDAEIVLLHEYAHHFMMNNFQAALPAWFIEGFAEFHSTARFEKDGGVGIGTPALHRAYGLVLGIQIPIERLLTNARNDLRGEQIEALYGRGWLLTHYLTFEPSRSGQLRNYLTALNGGTAPLAAAKAAFGDLKKLDRDLDQYLKQKRLKYLKLDPAKVAAGPVTVRRLTPGANAVMNLKIQSRRGVKADRSKSLAAELRKAAAPFANDAFVQAALAEAELDADNFTAAEAAADRAITADPKSIDALTYKARARIALAAAKGDEAAWKEARKSIVAANRADPDDPEPLILFYTSFREQGLKPSANATMGLVRALELAPQDRDLRMLVAYQQLQDGKWKEARDALSPIAFDPHGGKRAEAAASIVALLQSGADADKALESWNRFEAEGEAEAAD